MSWLRRLRNRWREDELSQEFDAELRFHLEQRIEINVRRGMPPEEAVRAARAHMGNVTRAREGMREARVVTWLDGLGSDLRYAVRVFSRHPMVSALTVLTLSLGIGANAAVFAVFQAALLRPLPYPAADRLVLLLDMDRNGRGLSTPTVPEVLELREASRSFDAVTFFDSRDFQTTGGEEPQRVIGARVDTSFLTTLGARPAVGRLLDGADGAERNGSRVVLAQEFWQRNFGADPTVIGRTLSLNGESYEIVGVLPDTFSLGAQVATPVDLYVPYPASAEYTSRAGQFASVRRVTALGRLRPGVTPEQASTELRTLAAGMVAAHPEEYKRSGLSMAAEPLHESLTRNSRPMMLLLVGLVATMLLIACVNTAQFLLAQSIEREPEFTVRRALGASRGRLVRQCLSEVLLVAVAAGGTGGAVAVWLTGVLRALMPRGTPLVGGIVLDRTALVFLLAVTVMCAIASSLAPAMRLSTNGTRERVDPRTSTTASRLRHAFIAVEVAMSVVLLVSAALLIRSLQELQRAQSGFSTERVTVLRLRGIGGGPSLGDTYARYLLQLATIKTIEAAGVTNSVFPQRPSVSFTGIGDTPDAAVLRRQQASYQIVSGGYFAALGVPLVAGRLFTDDDDGRRPPVAIVNREMAQEFWPRRGPLGQQIHAGEGPRAATMTIVGIVENVRPPFQTVDVPQMYVPYTQQSDPNMAVIVRTVPGASYPLNEIKRAIWAVEPRQAVFGIETLESQVARATSSQRAIATLTGGFSVLALAISTCGIYTVITYLVRRRFKEIAIRRAIGASSRHVIWSLGSSTLRWTAVGLLGGTAAAIAGTRALRAAISGIVPLDPALLTAVTVGYVLIAVLVIAVASRIAVRVDPVIALRSE